MKIQDNRAPIVAITLALMSASCFATSEMKLPVERMPKDGKIADFDFNGLEPENKVKSSASVSGVHMEMNDGCLEFDGVYHNEWEKDLVFPELNFDGFAIAMSVGLEGMPKRGIFIENQRGLISIGFRNQKMEFSFGHSANFVSDAEIVTNGWNWMVVSVDAIKKKVSFVVNGVRGMPQAMPSDFAWPIAPGASERDLRSVMLGDASCGVRFKGKIDDLIVYGRPLTAQEMRQISSNGGTAKKGSKIVKEDKTVLLRKLPRPSMPKDDLIADFDFGEAELDNLATDGEAAFSGKYMSVEGGNLVFDGKYHYPPKEDAFLTGLDFDHFTIAMSFNAQNWPEGFGQFFIIGRGCGNPLSMRIRKDKIEFQVSKDTIVIDRAIKLNEWNWFVCSVDAVNKKVGIVFNGKREMTRSLSPDFSWAIANGASDDALRGIQFGDPGFGKRYKGLLDDFIVYNRALSAEELVRISKRQPAAKVSKKSKGKSVVKQAAKELPKASATPVKGAWTLEMSKNRSYFWNSTISKDGIVIGTHCEGNEICVQPLTHVAEIVDLRGRIASLDGETYKLVGIGAKMSYGGGGKRENVVLRQVKLPETVRIIYDGAFEDSSIEEIALPSSLTDIGDRAFDGCIHLKAVTFPEGLQTIGQRSFARCTDLSTVKIPATVKRIGGLAFFDCGCLLSVDVLGATRFGERPFGGSTPVNCKFPKEKTCGPISLVVKKDPSLSYALNGRMKEPFLNSLKFGTCIRFISGCGSIRFSRYPEIAKTIDTSYHKVGPELVCGSSACWMIKEDRDGSSEKTKQSVALAYKMLKETFPKITFKELTWKDANEWPSSVNGLEEYYGRQRLQWKAIEANDFSQCVASSRTEEDGYRIDFRIWGSANSKTVFVSMDIVDTLMKRAWGAE